MKRTPISDLELQHSPNLARALKREPKTDQTLTLAHREELEKLFVETQERRDRAIADIQQRGEILTLTKFTSKGHAYDVEVVNPSVKIAFQCERQLLAFSKALSQPIAPDPEAERKASDAEFEKKFAHLIVEAEEAKKNVTTN